MPREIRRDFLFATLMLVAFGAANALEWLNPLPWPYFAVLAAFIFAVVLARWFVLTRGKRPR